MADRFGPRYAHAMRMRILLVAALGLVLISVLAGTLLNRAPAPAEASPVAFPALASRIASADRIELVHAGHVLWLQRRGQVWGLARQSGYPVRAGMTEALFTALLTLRVLTPAPEAFEDLHLADPFAPGAGSGTFVRILGTTGAVLCTVIVGNPGSSVIRRPGDNHAWVANNAITAPADEADWSQHALPPLDPADIRAVLDDGGLGDDAARRAVAEIPFTDAAPAPQHHPAPSRIVQLVLASGTAVLTVGMEQGQPWLLVSGTSTGASRLAPYAFALPDRNPLAVF